MLEVEFNADTTFALRLNPAAFRLPLVILPLTDKLLSVPTDVKLELTTFELSVLPIRLLASTLLAATPVS